MEGIIVKVPDYALIGALRNLYEQGDITLEQFAGSLRRLNERRNKERD